MKRILLSVTVLMFVATTSFALPVVDKAVSGLKDVATSPLEVSDNVKTEMHTAKFMPFGIAGGFLKGSFYMGKQVVGGIFKIITSPLEMTK